MNCLSCHSKRDILREIRNVGFAELLFVSLIILVPYSIIGIQFDIIVPFILCILALLKHKKNKVVVNLKQFRLLLGYVVLHEILLCLFLPSVPSYHINSLLLKCVLFLSIFLCVRTLDYDKIINSLCIVTVVVLIGLLYHLALLAIGHVISPIKLPFLPFSEESRLIETGYRPVSFFLEPSNLVGFLIFPLYFALYYKKYIISIVLVISILLTTSTNGVVLVASMLITYCLTQKISTGKRIMIVLICVSVAFFFIKSDATLGGREKIQNTELESNMRMVNGPNLIKAMPSSHLVFGMRAPNVDDYVDKTSYVQNAILIAGKNGSYFISSFWYTIAKFGFVGLVLYLLAFISLYKQRKELIYFFIPLLILKFSGGVFFNSGFFQWSTYFILFVNAEYLKSVSPNVLESSKKV